jgi:genome maintenance exonuclease 1
MLFHEAIEKYFSGVPYKDIVVESDESKKAWDSIKSILQDDLKLVQFECNVDHPRLFYQGRFDCLAHYKNKLSLMEWKLSTKRKNTLRDLHDYPIQLSAYLGALLSDPKFKYLHADNLLFVNTIIVNAYTDGSEPSINELDFNQNLYYWEMWLKRLKIFWLNLMKINKRN